MERMLNELEIFRVVKVFQDLPDLLDQEVSPAHLDQTVLTESLVILDQGAA